MREKKFISTYLNNIIFNILKCEILFNEDCQMNYGEQESNNNMKKKKKETKIARHNIIKIFIGIYYLFIFCFFRR